LNKVKKLMSIILVLMLIISSFSSSSICTAASENGVLANGISYEIRENGVFITGYTGDKGNLTIASSYIIDGVPLKIVGIAECAFSEMENLVSVEIPQSVKYIEDYAFDECVNLKSITVNSKDTTIGEYAFGFYWVKHKPVKVDGLVVKGYSHSAVYTYCFENDLSFEFIKPIGDYTGDNITDIRDLVRIKKMFAGISESELSLDFNGDGTVNAIDLTVFIYYLLRQDTELNTYEVTFKDKDGKVLKSQVVIEGFSATAPTAPDCEGYSFDGWDCDYNKITGETVIKPIYTEKVINEPTLTVGSATANAGDSIVNVPVSLVKNPGFLTMALKITFDGNALTLNKVTNGNNYAYYNFTSPKNKTSGCTAAWFASELPDEISDGELMILQFSVAGNALKGQYPITISCPSDGSTVDGNKSVITLADAIGYVNVENGEITTRSPKITADTKTASAGTTDVEIAVALQNNPGFLTMSLKTEYNSEYLTLTKITTGSSYSDYNFTAPKNKASGCISAWFASDVPQKVLDGDILVLHFSVASNTPIGQYPITVSCPNDGSTLDGNKQVFSLENAVGYITVN